MGETRIVVHRNVRQCQECRGSGELFDAACVYCLGDGEYYDTVAIDPSDPALTERLVAALREDRHARYAPGATPDTIDLDRAAVSAVLRALREEEG